MRISDWSSDVCSSDLTGSCDGCSRGWRHQGSGRVSSCALRVFLLGVLTRIAGGDQAQPALAFDIGLISDRQIVVEGKSVSVRVDVGGGRIIKNKKYRRQY